METCSLDRLGDAIAELSAHLDAATARLDLIREFDAREGWNIGFRSCAAWLAWRVGLDLGAARERVRVARALGTLPWGLVFLFWEFFTPFNQLGEPVPLIAVELVFWALIALAEACAIAVVMGGAKFREGRGRVLA